MGFKLCKIFFFVFIISCDSSKQQAFVPDSSGNINHLTVVMDQTAWNGNLGQTVRDEIATIYEGLPIDEPSFNLRYLEPKAFTGFGRHGRNVLWCRTDSINRFQLVQDQFARPQIVVNIKGEDEEIIAEYIKENASLIVRSIQENERKEKIRRMLKSPSKETTLSEKFGISLTYSSSYKTVKDTSNFVWIEKPILKGSMNLIAYTLPLESFDTKSLSEVIKLRDSIGKVYLPGRLPNTHMITEKAYKPYFYSTSLAGQKAYLIKGMWEVKRDFMAGPFVQYIFQHPKKEKWLVIEGFAFAPSVSKRDYMFELNSILSTLKFKEIKGD